MKTTELMIGDWVQIQYRDKRVKVTDIYDGKIYTTAISPLMEDEFAPIPLIPEILEKNGLALDRMGNYFPEDKRYDLEISEIEGDIYWTVCWGDYGVLRLRYVHELQHALRLCGIEKEIAL